MPCSLFQILVATGPSRVVTVNITTADDDDVALECLVADSNPPQVRFSEAMFPAASLSNTNMSWGSSSKFGGVPVTAQEQTVTSTLTSWLANLVAAAGIYFYLRDTRL